MQSCFHTASCLPEEMRGVGGAGGGGGGGVNAAAVAFGGPGVMEIHLNGPVAAAAAGGGADEAAAAAAESRDKILNLLQEYVGNAETLKVMARKTIIKSLNGKMPLKVKQLELPNSLKEYVLDLTMT